MATEKKGMIQTAMDAVDKATSKGGMVGKAMDAVAGVFTDERKPMQRASAKTAAKTVSGTTAMKKSAAKKSAAKKSAAKKAPAKKMDRALVSTMEVYEIKYLAQKHAVTQKAVKEAVGKVGHSRNKVEAELKRAKDA